MGKFAMIIRNRRTIFIGIVLWPFIIYLIIYYLYEEIYFYQNSYDYMWILFVVCWLIWIFLFYLNFRNLLERKTKHSVLVNIIRLISCSIILGLTYLFIWFVSF